MKTNTDDIQYKRPGGECESIKIDDTWEKTPCDEALIEQVDRGFRNFLRKHGMPEIRDGLKRHNMRIHEHKRRNND